MELLWASLDSTRAEIMVLFIIRFLSDFLLSNVFAQERVAKVIAVIDRTVTARTHGSMNAHLPFHFATISILRPRGIARVSLSSTNLPAFFLGTQNRANAKPLAQNKRRRKLDHERDRGRRTRERFVFDLRLRLFAGGR